MGDLSQAWAAEAESWIAFARSEAADPVFWQFNLPEFLKIVPAPAGLTLDVGCGEGRVGRALADRGHRLVGLDAAPALVAAARTHRTPIDAVVADAAALPIGSSLADVVLLFMVPHDVDDLHGVIQEAGRVLRPGGHLCMAMTHPIQGIGDFTGPERTGDYVITRPYFAQRRLTYSAERAGKRVALHFIHRPLSAYTEALTSAGFVVEMLREPVPGDELTTAMSDVTERQAIPSFIHLRARRE